jgi:hypothetical protein
MTNPNISHSGKRLTMPETPPADLKNQIRESILSLVDKDDIQIGPSGHVTFSVETGSAASLNRLLSDADHYGIFDHTLQANGKNVEYTIFSDLFPEIAKQAKNTRDQVQKTAEA